MDNFGTINGVPKCWWGSKAPSDKDSIWYVDGVARAFSDGEWKPVTSGGGSTLSFLKKFFDSCNTDGYVYDDDAIVGLKMPARYATGSTGNLQNFIYISDLLDESVLITQYVCFDVKKGVFTYPSIASDVSDISTDIIFIPVSFDSKSGSIGSSSTTGCLQISTTDKNTMKTAIDYLYNITIEKDKAEFIYYKDLK